MKQLSFWAEANVRSLFFLIVTLTFMMIGASETRAYETTQNCENCHGGFLNDPYISLSDGATWPDSLHDVHRNDMLGSDCDVCHAQNGRSPVVLDSSSGGSGLSPISCVGCHGRDEDMGNDSASAGRGAGLRQHHTNAGVSGCANCHDDADPANYTPVGEDVLPDYYANPGTNHPLIPVDSCNPNGSEGVFAGTLLGLDNDGNGIYDTADPACSTNTPPVADAGGPYSGTAGSPVSFDGSASTDPDGSIAAYAWDFGDGASGSGVSPSHSYATEGTYTVSLTVTDNDGGTDTASSTASIAPVSNTPPVADAGGPYSGTAGSPVSFDGSASTDPDGSIAAYAWDFGDGASGSGVSPSHSYATEGTYTVSLTVTDNDGGTDTASSTASIAPVSNTPPVADAGGPYSGTAGSPVSFDGSASTDPDGSIAAYAWDFGDGASGSGVSPSHSYATEGTYTVSLTVTDNDGGTDTASSTASIAPVSNTPPVADAGGPYSGTAGSPVSFDGSASTDPDGSIAAYAWDFGDGASGSGVSPSHSYATEGTYTVSLTVTDNDGGTDTASSTASIAPVSNTPPVADAGGPYSGTAGSPVSFDGSASTDPDGSIAAYAWDFGDGASGTGVSPSYSYATEGTYTVSLTVTDNDGGTDTASSTATIVRDDLPPSIVTITQASWESEDEDSELKVMGYVAMQDIRQARGTKSAKVTRSVKETRGPNRAKPRWRKKVIITNANTGERIGTTRVRPNGEWRFEKELDISPCRIRATFNDQFAEKEVKDAPVNCDDGTGNPPGMVMIKEAKWESEDEGSKLEVKGVKARQGEKVYISNALTGEDIGSTRVPEGGEWKFERELDIAPCRVRATIDNQFDEMDVKNAPTGCGYQQRTVLRQRNVLRQ